MWRGIVWLGLEKKKLADGCVMSRLTYGIQFWGLSINKTPMTKISKGAKSGDVLGPFQTFLDQNYWAIGRNELAIYV